MMWPFSRKRRWTREDVLRSEIIAGHKHLQIAMAAGDWPSAVYWVESLEHLDAPGIWPGLADYVRAKAAAQSVYEWFEPEYGRLR